MEIVSKYLTETDKTNIEYYLAVKYLDIYDGSIYKIQNKGNNFYGFPYYNENQSIGFKYFGYGYNGFQLESCNGYWKTETNIILDVEYLIISDDPISVLKYISSKYDFFNDKAVLCFVPKVMNKSIFDIIVSKYVIHNIVTVYDNPSNKELLKIKVLCYSTSENISVEKLNDVFKITYKNKELCVNQICYSSFRKKMNIKSNVKHKLNQL